MKKSSEQLVELLGVGKGNPSTLEKSFMTETVDGLQRPEEYRAARSHLYPSEQSFRWFLRQNRSELAKAGAIICPTGRWMVRPDVFDRAVVEIGTRRACKS